MKAIFSSFILMLLNLTSEGQKITCQSLHIGTFKSISKEFGTTLITRTKNDQTEENKKLGYKLIYDLFWISDCTYELRLKKVIKGDPALMQESKFVLTIKIKQIKKNSYITENRSTYSDKISTHEIMILK
ncbi:MAG: hypothetical protein JST02_05080 [Bacteroidetes bacterium]|nr:hypothetical protein [Bacteroidota bacterium]